MLIDGENLLRHALAGGVEILELFVQQIDDESHRVVIAEWHRLLPETNICLVSKAPMAKLQYGDRHESVIAIARQPSLALESLESRQRETLRSSASASGCYLVLDQMEKPGNLGAVLRTADAAGVAGVLLSDPMSETWNPNAIRSSLGAIFRVPMAAGSALQVQRWLNERSIGCFAAKVDATQSYAGVDYPRTMAIVVGSESQGLGSEWNGNHVQAVRIPMRGAVDSLNVSVSTSIILFEVLRQHGHLES
jgi:TrmH family RNA methyltransferase